MDKDIKALEFDELALGDPVFHGLGNGVLVLAITPVTKKSIKLITVRTVKNLLAAFI